MTCSILTLAQTTDISRGLVFMVVGMTVVFGALILVGLSLVLIRKLSERPAPASAPAPEPAPAAAAEPVEDPNLIVVLSAAAAAACGTPVRVRRVRFLYADRRGNWAERGRVDVQTSHNFQSRKRSS